tara:strand:- start:699 stop:896 length:198 start_codon:yes stop_codon:yes gene_type:complete
VAWRERIGMWMGMDLRDLWVWDLDLDMVKARTNADTIESVSAAWLPLIKLNVWDDVWGEEENLWS